MFTRAVSVALGIFLFFFLCCSMLLLAVAVAFSNL